MDENFDTSSKETDDLASIVAESLGSEKVFLAGEDEK
jgi:hypothetical protein